MFARAPGNFLDLDPTAPTSHPPHGIEEDDGEAPDRDKLEAARRHLVVATGRFMTPRTTRFGPLPGANINLNPVGVGAQASSGIDEAREMVTGIE